MLHHWHKINGGIACGGSGAAHLSITFDSEPVKKRCPKCHKLFEKSKESGQSESQHKS